MAVSPHQPSGGAAGACERAGIGSAAVVIVADDDSATASSAPPSSGLRPQATTNPKAHAHAMELRMAVASVGIERV